MRLLLLFDCCRLPLTPKQAEEECADNPLPPSILNAVIEGSCFALDSVVIRHICRAVFDNSLAQASLRPQRLLYRSISLPEPRNE